MLNGPQPMTHKVTYALQARVPSQSAEALLRLSNRSRQDGYGIARLASTCFRLRGPQPYLWVLGRDVLLKSFIPRNLLGS